jgi:hypothetical protein
MKGRQVNVGDAARSVYQDDSRYVVMSMEAAPKMRGTIMRRIACSLSSIYKLVLDKHGDDASGHIREVSRIMVPQIAQRPNNQEDSR